MDSLTSTGESATAINENDFCTNEQFESIKTLSYELDIDPSDAITSLFKISVEDLSKSGARDVIKYLKNLKGK